MDYSQKAVDTTEKEVWQISRDLPCTEDSNLRSALVIGRLPVCAGVPSNQLCALVVPGKSVIPRNVVVGD